jgi:transcriptional regulator with XRE-family HTH domain
MKRLDMSIARLSRESGISETTIRRIGQPEKRQRSTLVAISAALGYPYDYLVDILRGEANPEASAQSPAEAAFIKELLRAEVDPLKEKVDVIDGKVDLLLERQPDG